MDRGAAEQGELQAMIDDLAEELRRSVVVNDPVVRVLCTSRHYGDEDSVRIRAVLQHDAGPEVSRFILGQGAAQWSSGRMLAGSTELGLHPRWCVPLRDRGELLGLLMVIDAEHTLRPPQIRRIEKVSRAAAAVLSRQRAAGDANRCEHEKAVRALIGQDQAAREAALRTTLARAAANLRGTAVCLVVQLDGPDLEPAELGSALRGVLDSAGRSYGNRALTVGRDLEGTMIVSEGRGEGEVTALARRLVDELDRLLPRPGIAVVGLGDPVTQLVDAARSYWQARIAARCARLSRELGPVATWQGLGPYAPLLTLAEAGLDDRAIPAQVVALLAHDKGPRLVQTLRMFLDEAGSIPRTAERLHLHRSTLYYRFEQIREITGLDLDNGRDRLLLHTGLLLVDLLDQQPAVRRS